MNDIQTLLLALVKCGIGKEENLSRPDNIDWEELFELAQRQGVCAIALDGITCCYEKGLDVGIDFQTKMEWIGLSNQMEVYYRQYETIIGQLATFYRNHGIRTMVLKGYGLSLDYPIPSHRPCGDIDVYLFGEQKRADKLVHDELGIEVDRGHHHHTVFCYQEESVENHYDFLNVYVRRSNKRIEAKLKEMASRCLMEDGTSKMCDTHRNHSDIRHHTSYIRHHTSNIIIPSAEFNAIYLLRHCAAHFASTKMTVRQILDWGFFMEKHHHEINWETYLPYMKQEGMYRFYNLLGLYCMSHLGFDASIFHGLYSDPIFDRFSNEVMTPEFKDRENGRLLKSLSVKPRRWWHNRWKNRLCYPDSMWSEFIYGLWAKVLKPSHFIQ